MYGPVTEKPVSQQGVHVQFPSHFSPPDLVFGPSREP